MKECGLCVILECLTLLVNVDIRRALESKTLHCVHGIPLDTNPRGVGGGVREGGRGGSRKFFSILGAFLNFPFHPEHFEETQVG